MFISYSIYDNSWDFSYYIYDKDYKGKDIDPFYFIKAVWFLVSLITLSAFIVIFRILVNGAGVLVAYWFILYRIVIISIIGTFVFVINNNICIIQFFYKIIFVNDLFIRIWYYWNFGYNLLSQFFWINYLVRRITWFFTIF